MKAGQIERFEDKKLEAMSKYKTQIRALGGMGMFERVIRRYHHLFGGAEPYWRAGHTVSSKTM
jgi:hypothetical protein